LSTFERPLSVTDVTDPTTDKLISLSTEKTSTDTTVLRVGGEVDMVSSPLLRQRVTDEIDGGVRRLILDFNDVGFMGTSGLAVLVEARSGAMDANIELWLVCAKRVTLRSLDIAGLRPLFRVADTVTNALEGTPSA
jgi:anti-sigma B factor antagonist